MTTASNTGLRLQNVAVSYGLVRAVEGLSLDAPEGQITALVGSNGAGKSTLLRAITSLVRVSSGTIEYAGTRIENSAASKAVRRGLGHVPEGRQVFGDLTVLENLHLGAYRFRGRTARPSDISRMYALFPRLEERRAQRAGTLSGGEQQMLVIARALIGRPTLLLLDEPSLGLAPLMAAQILDALVELNRSDGLSVLMTEQNVAAALRIADRGYVLSSGQVVMTGTGAELAADPTVREHYLGSLGHQGEES
jgi:branched-chain amino acid transport system ATP-binding protein